MPTLRIPTAQVFRPLLEPARYKGAFGGRGSGKSHFFGSLVVEECLSQPGTLVVCIREKQMTLAQSSKRLIEDKIAAFGVGSGFRIYDEKIKTPGDGLIIFQGMQDHTAESIKSLEGYRIAWIDEAQALSQTASHCCGRPSAPLAARFGRAGIRGARPMPSTNFYDSASRTMRSLSARRGAIILGLRSNWRKNASST